MTTLLSQVKHGWSSNDNEIFYYIIRITTSCLPSAGCRRLRNLYVRLRGTKQNCKGNVFSPPRSLFTRGSTSLLVMSSAREIGDVVGVDLNLSFSGINKRRSVWVLTDMEVMCCKTSDLYHMRECLKTELPVGAKQTIICINLLPGKSKEQFRSSHTIIGQIMDSHLWMFSKYNYGEYRPQDGIILLFLVLSLSTIGNFLVLYLNNNTGDPTRPFTLPTMVVVSSQILNVIVFILSLCFEGFLRNIRMKDKGQADTLIPKSKPEREYNYGDRLLHRIYVNIGLHRCPETDSENDAASLGPGDGRPTGKRVWAQLDDISTLINNWQAKLKDTVNCNICQLTEHFGVIRKPDLCPFLFSSPKFTKLNTASMAILMKNDYCSRFDFATDLYYESERFSPRRDYTLEIAMTFVDSLICLLKLLKIHYLDDYELKDISDIFNMYRSFAYYIMHHHVHKLLATRNKVITAYESSAIPDNYTKVPSFDTENSNLHHSSLSSFLSKSYSADVKFKIGSEMDSKTDSEISNIKDKPENKDLDDALNFILDSILLMPLEGIPDMHRMKSNMDRIETLYACAQNLLINSTWRHGTSTSYSDPDNIEKSSPWQIPQTRIIEGDIMIEHFLKNFQAFEHLCEVVIEKAIDKLEDDIFFDLLEEVPQESLSEPPKACLESPAVHLTNNAIAEAKEELSAEMRFPAQAFSRMTLFVTVAKHLNQKTYLIKKCPALVGFLEVSETDINNSDKLIFFLMELIVYKLSHSPTFKEQNFCQQYLDKSFMKNLRERVLSRTRDGLSALIREFVMSIIAYEKTNHALNLTKMYVSASLDRYAELQESLIKSCIVELLQRWEFFTWSRMDSYLMKIFHQEKDRQTPVAKEEIQISVESDPATDFENGIIPTRNFFDLKDEELGLPRGYLPILHLLTYQVWLQEDSSPISNKSLWQLYLAYFGNSKKPFPHWTKKIIHLLMVTLILVGFICFPLCENLLRGSPMKEWALLLLLSLAINAIVLESLKVAAICYYKKHWQKTKQD